MEYSEERAGKTSIQKTNTIHKIISLGDIEKGEGARPLGKDKKERSTERENTAFL